MSSINSVISLISERAWSIRPAVSASGSSAVSSSARRRASGVRSSCETAAVNPERSSS